MGSTQTHLPLTQAFGGLRQINVEQKRIGRNVIALDLEMVLGANIIEVEPAGVP